MISQLVVYDMQSGQESLVFETDSHIEAPNWTRDGTAFLVNAGGRLLRVPIDAPKLLPVDTGTLKALNNDHGLSPDGRLVALSDKTETGESRIYVMPLEGGDPVLVTPNVRSYWHGWSPDGSTLAYAADRGNGFQIHVCPVKGGDETCLTSGFAHCDGPDYSADGHWIWFNGERDDRVDLWRVSATGGTPVRMTHDDRVNWFPHPSPKGDVVVYLAYPPGTRGHPPNRRVELRAMPAEGGESRLLTRLFGGQGTINVPSWSPDGTAFAFVRYLV